MNNTVLYQYLNKVVNKFGFDIRRFPARDQRGLLKYLKDNSISTCIDVGANTGQYGLFMRSNGYTGKIVSFEPQKKPFEKLKRNADKDTNWEAHNIGLGDYDGNAVINISENSVSSSILDISETLVKAVAETKYISTEEIAVNRLDTFIGNNKLKDNFFLKIDAQGFESKIIEGAGNCFSQVHALQLELACITLYKEEKLFDEMKQFIEGRGFYVSNIESSFSDADSGRLLQADVTFLREV